MEKVTPRSNDLPFNGPLETGVRAVLNLHACFPKTLDIQRLTALDYLIVRTSVVGGPLDMHPAAPITTPVTQVRRKMVQDALNLMMARDLVTQVVAEDGIAYCAGESSAFFVDAIQTPYLTQLFHRAQWLADFSKDLDNEEFDKRMKVILDNWVSEFQDEVGSAGGSK
ncbi:hypothetical protein KUV47_12010 [Vannielia litorea]|uniref:ABC-three component system middle component 2 n=1 Tax=Vannielia litorea TaxID=1217970 RepID=UPI001C98A910|nr:ABC-three component system middle component 2 [Vannielia litorea]MBY6153939.1 hypothetical protein [Vannielia litorea]